MINRSEFAVAFLNALSIPVNYDNVASIVAWESMENAGAANNPLATERIMNQGESDYNTEGVKNYPTFSVGLEATVQTILNGYYADLLYELRYGNFQSITTAIDNSPWGTRGVNTVIVTYGDWLSTINSGDSVSVDVPAYEGLPSPVVAPVEAPPVPSYVIAPGDTLYAIAVKFNVSEAVLFSTNKSELDAYARSRGYANSNNGSLIFPGTKILIP